MPQARQARGQVDARRGFSAAALLIDDRDGSHGPFHGIRKRARARNSVRVPLLHRLIGEVVLRTLGLWDKLPNGAGESAYARLAERRRMFEKSSVHRSCFAGNGDGRQGRLR